jgi:ABC-type dipeptide/oligopeptide/nickel transport system ATPase component
VLDLLEKIRESEGIAIVIISHNFNEVLNYCERIAVFSRGELLEEGPSWAILETPLHAETRKLLSSVPGQELDVGQGLYLWEQWKQRSFKGWQFGKVEGHRVNLDFEDENGKYT